MAGRNLPDVSWERVNQVLYKLAKDHTGFSILDDSALEFLQCLGLATKTLRPLLYDYSKEMEDPRWWVRGLAVIGRTYEERARVSWQLTPLGQELYLALFVDADYSHAWQILRDAALRDPVIQVVVRHFTDSPSVQLQQLRNLLRLYRVDVEYASDMRLQTFLELLEGFGIAEVERSSWSFQIAAPSALESGSAKGMRLLGPATPYSNRVEVRDILTSLAGAAYWLDKHFRKEALRWIIDAVDGDHLRSLIIISGPDNATESADADYQAARAQLQHRGVTLEWVVVPSGAVQPLHDRWIWDETQSFNIPPVGAVHQGKLSEILPSQHRPNVDGYLEAGRPISDYRAQQNQR